MPTYSDQKISVEYKDEWSACKESCDGQCTIDINKDTYVFAFALNPFAASSIRLQISGGVIPKHRKQEVYESFQLGKYKGTASRVTVYNQSGEECGYEFNFVQDDSGLDCLYVQLSTNDWDQFGLEWIQDFSNGIQLISSLKS